MPNGNLQHLPRRKRLVNGCLRSRSGHGPVCRYSANRHFSIAPRKHTALTQNLESRYNTSTSRPKRQTSLRLHHRREPAIAPVLSSLHRQTRGHTMARSSPDPLTHAKKAPAARYLGRTWNASCRNWNQGTPTRKLHTHRLLLACGVLPATSHSRGRLGVDPAHYRSIVSKWAI